MEKCHGVAAKCAESLQGACEFELHTCHNENTNDEEGNGKPPREIHFLEKSTAPVSGFSYARKLVCNAVFNKWSERSAIKIWATE